MKNLKRVIAFMLSTALILSSSVWEPAGTVSAKARLDNGTPWIDTELVGNVKKNTPTDPTDDFHLYAGKKWFLNSKIPKGYFRWSRYAERDKTVKNQCIGLLEDESIDSRDAELSRKFYSLILDWGARDALGVSEIKPTADRILLVSDISGLTELLLSEEGTKEVDSLVGLDVESGLTDSSMQQVYLSHSGLLLGDSAEYEHRSELGRMQYSYLKDVFVHIAGRLGMSKEEAKSRFDSAIAFEKKLAPFVYSSDEQMKDGFVQKVNNEMDFAELAVFDRGYPLTQIIDRAGARYNGKYVVLEPEYLNKLNELYTSENLEAIKSRLYVKYVLGYSDYLDSDIVSYDGEAYNDYFGVEGYVSEEESAFQMVAGGLPGCLQRVYIEKYTTPEDKQQMEGFCRKVISTYRRMLSENKWASRQTIRRAIRKLDTMKIHAAYPDEWEDCSSLSFEGKSLIGAVRELEEYYTEKEISEIGKPVDDDKWGNEMDILSCNAFYSPSENTINMLLGMMGSPFYSKNMPKEELYASLGAFWIGHEVSHAFDSNGAEYDENGNLNNWWTAKDRREFNKRIQKLNRYLDTIQPFGNYRVKGENVNTEMLADITGLQCAITMAKSEKNFNYDKFFKKYARLNLSLGVYSNEVAALTQDVHPLDYIRTNVAVQQFDEFIRTYHVRRGDAMYLAPKDRLLVW